MFHFRCTALMLGERGAGRGQNYDEAVAFIKLKFAELNLNPDKKTIYMHETCATDTNQVQLVISSVIDTIIQKNLQKAGMM
ncbi:unnamed protein product [Cylicostephanus goldi]|uniref:Uncharacterized protein n=1 Tax=Cylicostephanus goldi TaxID=71465 RepID=A0A3P6T3N5_CYLGO|nr:unnamed protein product [Cylicostephanus goldi]